MKDMHRRFTGKGIALPWLSKNVFVPNSHVFTNPEALQILSFMSFNIRHN